MEDVIHQVNMSSAEERSVTQEADISGEIALTDGQEDQQTISKESNILQGAAPISEVEEKIESKDQEERKSGTELQAYYAESLAYDTLGEALKDVSQKKRTSMDGIGEGQKELLKQDDISVDSISKGDVSPDISSEELVSTSGLDTEENNPVSEASSESKKEIVRPTELGPLTAVKIDPSLLMNDSNSSLSDSSLESEKGDDIPEVEKSKDSEAFVDAEDKDLPIKEKLIETVENNNNSLVSQNGNLEVSVSDDMSVSDISSGGISSPLGSEDLLMENASSQLPDSSSTSEISSTSTEGSYKVLHTPDLLDTRAHGKTENLERYEDGVKTLEGNDGIAVSKDGKVLSLSDTVQNQSVDSSKYSSISNESLISDDGAKSDLSPVSVRGKTCNQKNRGTEESDKKEISIHIEGFQDDDEPKGNTEPISDMEQKGNMKPNGDTKPKGGMEPKGDTCSKAETEPDKKVISINTADLISDMDDERLRSESENSMREKYDGQEIQKKYFNTTAGRISVLNDGTNGEDPEEAASPPVDPPHVFKDQVGQLIARANGLIAHVDAALSQSDFTLPPFCMDISPPQVFLLLYLKCF